MICDICKEEINDKCTYCPKCGNRISMIQDSVTKWEYKDFIYKFPDDTPWFNLKDISYVDNFAEESRMVIWNEYRSIILSQLQSDIDDGWETIDTIGPNNLVTKHHSIRRIHCLLWPFVFFLLLLTWGLFYFAISINKAELIEYRLPLRRKIK